MHFRIRAILFVFLSFLLSLPLRAEIFPTSPHREVRAVWLTTIGGLDWPHSYAHSSVGIARQKAELAAHLDRLKELGVNTVLLQTRIRGTVIYPSAIEPWDGCLSGTPGKSPGYDALEYAVEECHRRGMALQAWVVAFPLTSLTVTKQLGRESVVKRRPDLCVRTGDHWMMDPGVPATAEYLAALCREIASRYDIDGIHLDYIRYPEKEVPFSDHRSYRRYGAGQSLKEWRRDNVTRCVRRVSEEVRKVKPWVLISCSPVGKYDDLPRFSSFGWNARVTVSQDVTQWMSDGLVDEIFPMMYFRGNHFYPFALDWMENASGRIVVPGLGAYLLSPKEKDWSLETLTREICFLRTAGSDGQAFFRSRFVEENVKGIGDFLRYSCYTSPSLLPSLTWRDSIVPTPPRSVTAKEQNHSLHISWSPASDPTPGDKLRYNIYMSDSFPVKPERARLLASYLSATDFRIECGIYLTRRAYYAVTSIDRYGNESTPAAVNEPSPAASLPAGLSVIRDGRLTFSSGESGMLTLRDAEGTEVLTLRDGDTANVSALRPGIYTLWRKGRRGAAHLTERCLIPLPE